MSMSWLQILVLAALRGLTGILPLSDSGFQLIARDLLGLPLNGEADLFLDGLCLLAVTLVICIVYFRELRACFLRPRGRYASELERLGNRQWMLLVCSLLFSIPGLVFGWGLSGLNRLLVVSALSLVNGFLVFAADRMSRGAKELPDATIGDAAAIGLAQSLSVVPGFSRTGLCLTFGIFRGLDPAYCLQFSLLAAIPYYFIRALILIVTSAKPDGGIALYFGGMVLCGVLSYLALRLLRLSIRRGSGGLFAFISWGASLLLFMLYLIS